MDSSLMNYGMIIAIYILNRQIDSYCKCYGVLVKEVGFATNLY